MPIWNINFSFKTSLNFWPCISVDWSQSPKVNPVLCPAPNFKIFFFFSFSLLVCFRVTGIISNSFWYQFFVLNLFMFVLLASKIIFSRKYEISRAKHLVFILPQIYPIRSLFSSRKQVKLILSKINNFGPIYK